MKVIEKGEPVDIEKLGWKTTHLYVGEQPVLEDTVHYIAEIQANVIWEKKEIMILVKTIGKKSDLMCDDCGTNFKSHKGLCTSCYVRQL